MSRAAPQPVLLVELNEVSPSVFERYAAARPGSAVARVWAGSRRFRTELPHCGLLEPWTAWPSFHRGVPNSLHRIFSLGQPLARADAICPPLWRLLSSSGREVGVFGSLHARLEDEPDPERYAFFVPDFFSPHERAHPASLSSYQAFNLQMGRASKRNVSRKVPLVPALQFLAHAGPLGLTARTAIQSVAQLAHELAAPHRRVRRRTLQMELMADVWLGCLLRYRPAFATFFSNAVAAALHRYWAAAFPGDYSQLPLSPEYLDRCHGEVWHAFDAFDRILEHLLGFAARHGYLVTIASAFGQGPVPTHHSYGFVTIVDLERFLRAMGLKPNQWRAFPTMTPHFSLRVEHPVTALLRKSLASLRLGAHRMAAASDVQWPMSFAEPELDFFSLYFQLDDYRGAAAVSIGESTLSFEAAGLGTVPHEDGVEYTAYHILEGTLLLHDPRQPRPSSLSAISALDYAPSLLTHFDVPVPDLMRGRRDLFQPEC